MAAKYRKIDPRIWTDEGFMELDAVDKLVALYAITAQSNRCGMFRFSEAKAAEETGLDPDSYHRAFGKVCHTLGWKYDRQRRVLYLPTWWKYNPPENPKHLEGCLKDLHELPQTTLIAEFAANDRHLPKHCREAFAIAMQIAMANQEQEQEQKQERKKGSAGAEAAAAAPASANAAKGVKGSVDEPTAASASARAARRQPAGPHHELIRVFCDGWRDRYGRPYAFNRGKDGNHVKWILGSTLGDVGEAASIVRAYLADDDPFVSDKGHPIGLLVSNFSKYWGRRGTGGTRSNGHGTDRRPPGHAGAAARGEYESGLAVTVRKLA